MSNAILSLIASRRSHRQYKPDQLTNEQLDAILTAALQSPSANNKQPWHFSVIQNAAIIQRVHDAAARVALGRDPASRSPRYDDGAFQVFYHAPTVIVVSYDDKEPRSLVDCGIAVQNIVLAAESLGLGSIILGLPRDAFLGTEKLEIEKLINIPQGYAYGIGVALGTPTDHKPAHEIGSNKVSFIR